MTRPPQNARSQLMNRILASRQFAHAHTLKRILAYLVERAEAPQGAAPKEYEIAVQRILWDLVDTNNDNRDQVTINDQQTGTFVGFFDSYAATMTSRQLSLNVGAHSIAGNHLFDHGFNRTIVLDRVRSVDFAFTRSTMPAPLSMTEKCSRLWLSRPPPSVAYICPSEQPAGSVPSRAWSGTLTTIS